MVKVGTFYKTTDGSIFDTPKEAEDWQNVIEAGDMLYADTDYFHGVINVSGGLELKEFLKRNADWIKPMMGWK